MCSSPSSTHFTTHFTSSSSSSSSSSFVIFFFHFLRSSSESMALSERTSRVVYSSGPAATQTGRDSLGNRDPRKSKKNSVKKLGKKKKLKNERRNPLRQKQQPPASVRTELYRVFFCFSKPTPRLVYRVLPSFVLRQQTPISDSVTRLPSFTEFSFVFFSTERPPT